MVACGHIISEGYFQPWIMIERSVAACRLAQYIHRRHLKPLIILTRFKGAVACSHANANGIFRRNISMERFEGDSGLLPNECRRHSRQRLLWKGQRLLVHVI